MTKYIDKDALIAEIKKLSQKAIELYGYSQFNTAYNKVLESIDTLEVKEVNLEKEIDVWYQKPPKEFENIEECAKHFFELGLKAKKNKL